MLDKPIFTELFILDSSFTLSMKVELFELVDVNKLQMKSSKTSSFVFLFTFKFFGKNMISYVSKITWFSVNPSLFA